MSVYDDVLVRAKEARDADAKACAKTWTDTSLPPAEITAVAEVMGLDTEGLWYCVEGVRGWEEHDPGYEQAVWETALTIKFP